MSEAIDKSRRQFLKVGISAAGGLAVGASLVPRGRYAQAAESTSAGNPLEIWLNIAPDNVVTVSVASSEMGQGIYSSTAMLVAEELDIDWRDVRAEMAPAAPVFTNPMFGMQATGGSTSTRWSFTPLRTVGATARELLRQAAADAWQVELAGITARRGRLEHAASGRSASYGDMAAAAAALPAPDGVKLKEPADWSLLGTPAPRLDTPMKVDGSAQFGADINLPGMLVATVAMCPTFGGKLKSVDEKPALAVRGVRQVLPLEDAVMVVADGYWPAKKGLDALQPAWERGANQGLNNESFSAELKTALEKPGNVAHSAGDVDGAFEGTRIVESLYEVPHLAHATMEPLTATAHVRADGVDIWAPTQAPGPVSKVAAETAGVTPDEVNVHTTFLGGGFGRKYEIDFIMHALTASRLMGAPVKVIWSREQDTRHDYYRPASMSAFKAGLDDQGLPVAWHNRIACPSIFARVNPSFVKNGIDETSVEGASELPYAIANQRIDYRRQETGLPIGFWRAVGNSHNGFYVQSFIDELAHAAGSDPLDYQLALLKDSPRHAEVLRLAADKAGWRTKPGPGRFRGLALHPAYGSICAMVMEIELKNSTQLRVSKVSAAVDCGTALNPDTIVAQIESSLVYGLTAAAYGSIAVENGAVQEGNFDNYRMLKLAQMPETSVHVISSGAPIGGIGEVGLPPAAPALTNAIFAATGQRIRRLPLTASGFELV